MIWNWVSAMRLFPPGRPTHELAALAFDAGGIALEGVQARDRNQVLLVEVADRLQLADDQLRLAGFRRLLRPQSHDLVLRLGDALLELVLLRLAGGRARDEQRTLEDMIF